MKTKLLLLLLVTSFSSFAQYTAIPNLNFENKLIALGYDSGKTDGRVLTSSINTITSLNVAASSITNLTGIQDFLALTTLICNSNQLTALDVSKNTALEYLDCRINKLTALDVSNNTALITLNCNSNKLTALDVSMNIDLTTLICSFNLLTGLDVSKNLSLNSLNFSDNQLTALDVSNNTALESLDCRINQLTALDVSNNTALITLNCNANKLMTLDVSSNTALIDFSCGRNQLTSLNLKNGNNVNFINMSGNFIINPNLTCIQVDNDVYSNTNWPKTIDATASYSTSCTTLGIAESVFNTVAVYPNPVKGDLYIDNSILEKATVYDVLGKLVKTKTFANGSNSNSINLTGLPGGVYYIYLESQGATIVKKIIVE